MTTATPFTPAPPMPQPSEVGGEHSPQQHPDALRFFALLGWQPGHVETTGNMPSAANDDKIVQVRGTQRFTYVRPDAPHTAANVLQRCATHIADSHDPFISVLSYRSKDRDKTKAQPGRVVFVDDWQPAPGRLTPNFALETSPGNFHGFFIVDLPTGQRLTQHEYVELATRAAAAVGGDSSGIDLTQLTRVPGTINSKAKHDGWVVRLHEWHAEPYSLDTLRTAWPTVTHTAPATAAAPNTPPADWSQLATSDGAALLQSPRWQGLIRARPQLTQLLWQRERVVLTRSTGAADDSDSAQVACFVFNTIGARSKQGEHVPLNEIRAVALALQPALWPNYSDADAFAARVDHEIARYMPKGERNPVATRFITGQAPGATVPPQPLTAATTKRAAGRPRGSADATKHQVLHTLAQITPDAFGRRCYYIGDLAARIGKAPRTVQRALQQLETDDRALNRGQEPGRGGRAYAVLSVDLGVPKIPAIIAETPTMEDDSRGAITHDECRSTTPQTSENVPLWNKEVGEHSPEGVPAPEPAPAGVLLGGSVQPAPQALLVDPRVQAFAAWLDLLWPGVPLDAAAILALYANNSYQSAISGSLLLVAVRDLGMMNAAARAMLAADAPRSHAPWPATDLAPWPAVAPEPAPAEPGTAYYDPHLAGVPVPPAQPHERHESQRSSSDVSPMQFSEHAAPDAGDVAEQASMPHLAAGSGVRRGSWQTAYRAELAAMQPSALAGECKRQQNGVGRAERECLPWLDKARQRLDMVYAELQQRRDAQPPKRAPKAPRRARSASAAPVAPVPPVAAVQTDLFAGAPLGVAARLHAPCVSPAAFGIAA